MKRGLRIMTVLACCCMAVALATAQEFPPTLEHNKGPFPYGTETVREDSPVDISDPSPNGVIHEITAYRGTPVVDGDITDEVWQKLPWTPLEWYIDQVGRTEEGSLYDESLTPSYWDGLNDYFAWFKILWDDDFIYLATKRMDDDYSFVDGTDAATGNIWQNDGWQIKLDTRPALDFAAESPGSEIGFCLVDQTEEAYNYWGNTYNSNKALELADGANTSTSASTDGKAIYGNLELTDEAWVETFEIAFISWEEIVADEAQMFSICALDRDMGSQEAVLQWAQGIYVKDPEQYGSILWSSQEPSGTGVSRPGGIMPGSFALQQNFPNPFNPETSISYTLRERGVVSLMVCDMTGKTVASLVENESQGPGEYTVSFNAAHLTSGVYLYRLQNGSDIMTRKMMLVK